MQNQFRVLAIVWVAAAVLLAPVVPPLAYALNWTSAWLTEQRAYTAATLIFRYLYAFGDATAANNLGVLCAYNANSCDGLPNPQALFENARSNGISAAGYNLAWTLPSNHDTREDIVERGLNVLQESVAKGDVHAGVLLADYLYFNNRDRFVSDRKALKLTVLEAAAATGDTDYRYIFADQLIDQARTAADAGDGTRAENLMRKGLEELIAVDAAGDTRAASMISFLLRQVLDRFPQDAIPVAISNRSRLDWSRRAASDGRFIAHRCSLAFSLVEASGETDQNDVINKLIAEALPHLQVCAAATKDNSQPSTPFGQPALYLGKLRGSRSALVNSPGHANMKLGDLYAQAHGVPRDIPRARTYYQRALTVHKFTTARESLDKL